MSKQEEIIEVCGKKVVVRYARTQEEACASCAFCSRKECHDLDCNMRDIIGESVCRYAYFVYAEEGKILPKLREFLATATPEELEAKYRELEYLLAPKDEDANKAAEKYGKEHTILPDEYNDGDIPVYEGWTAEAFKAGIAYERERATKETFDTFLRTLAKRSGVEAADCRIVRVGDHNAVEVETDEYYSGLERFSDGDKVNLIIVKKKVQL